jgi:SpoVK/Ycf46/Vps4 family AAA+-type ATPase
VIRSRLQDAAVAAAKACAHDEVQPRHVIFAVARTFGTRPELTGLLPEAKRALEPRGGAFGVPKRSAEAAALLDSIATEQDAVAAAVAALKGTERKSGRHSQATEQVPDQAAAPAQPAVATQAVAAPSPAEQTQAVLAELDALIGLGSVKAQLRSVIAVVQANQERVRAGMAPVSPGLHLVFTGPPGTGKTTVARLVARLYASTGALKGSRLTEASRHDLVAGFVGQSALKTAEVISKTRPGVLFIDEAYSLTPGFESDFTSEVIATLVKAMEDHRDDFAVIAAGYGPEMADFVASNPGLRSRFKTYIEFPDYSPEELTRIFAGFASESGIALQSGVLERAAEVFGQALEKPDFGNARFARSLFEQAYAGMSARAAADGVVSIDELTEIRLEDLPAKMGNLEREQRRIGFGE